MESRNRKYFKKMNPYSARGVYKEVLTSEEHQTSLPIHTVWQISLQFAAKFNINILISLKLTND